LDKEDVIRAFVVSLKVALRNASIYTLEHPAFAEGIADLRKKLDDLFEFIIPLNIGFTPRSLFIDDRFYEKEKVFQELARLFHFRKIKSITIDQNINPEELQMFIARTSEPAKDILKDGGPIAILEQEGIESIFIEELDYRELLQGEGEELKEIWVRLMQEALEKEDKEQINELADNFAKVIKEFSPQEIAENPETKETIKKFFSYLKDNEGDRFTECGKDLIKAAMRRKDKTPQEAFQELRQMTGGILEEDLALTFWGEMLQDESFEPLNVSIFSMFVENKKEGRVNYQISKMFRSNEILNENVQVLDKLKDLLHGPENELLSPIYRNTLHTLLKQMTWEQEQNFDYDQLFRSTRFILANLFENEIEPDDAVDLLKRILDQWDRITQERDFEYLKVLYDDLEKRGHAVSSEQVYKTLRSRLAEFVENAILEGDLNLYLEYFISRFDHSAHEVNVYLDKIFTEGKVTPYILKAYFKFHTEYLFYFNLNLDTYASDTNLIERIIDGLQMVDSRISFVTLKHIFTNKNPRIKRRVLEAMQEITLYESNFLLPIMRDKDMSLKAEALLILVKDEDTRKKALSRIFLIHSPFGIRNKRIIEHIQMVGERDIQEARSYLETLEKRKAFWNRGLREATTDVLEKWG